MQSLKLKLALLSMLLKVGYYNSYYYSFTELVKNDMILYGRKIGETVKGQFRSENVVVFEIWRF